MFSIIIFYLFCYTWNFVQGDRTQKVGVVDSEYIVHQSIQTLGGQSAKKVIYKNFLYWDDFLDLNTVS